MWAQTQNFAGFTKGQRPIVENIKFLHLLRDYMYFGGLAWLSKVEEATLIGLTIEKMFGA